LIRGDALLYPVHQRRYGVKTIDTHTSTSYISPGITSS
jgi:hypothetical protein